MEALYRTPLLGALIVTTIWGINVVMMKIAVLEMSPVLFTALRFALLSLLLLPFRRIEPHLRWPVLRIALVMGIGHFLLLSMGINYVDSALASIILLFGSPLSSLLAFLFLKERMKPAQMLLLAIAMLGATVPVMLENDINIQVGALLIIGCSLMWAIGNLQVRKLPSVPVFTLSFWIGLVSAPFCLLLHLYHSDGELNLSFSTEAWLAVAYVVLCSSILAYAIWYRLINENGISRLVSVIVLQPAITLVAGYLILAETLSGAQLIGAGISLLAIYGFYRIPSEKAAS